MRPAVPALLLMTLILSGCIAADTPPAARPGPASDAGDAARTPVEMQGTTWTIACARATAFLHCETVLGGSALTDPLPAVSGPRALNATLSWDPASPLTERLAIGVVALVDGRPELVPDSLRDGTSPLRLDIDLGAAPSEDLAVHVIYYSRVGTDDANVHFSIRQDWTLVGHILSGP